MAIDASIPLSVRPAEQIDPMGVLGKVLALKGAQQQQEQRAQEIQLGGLQIQQHQQTLADMQRVDAAMAQPGGRDAVIKSLPGHLQLTVQKQFDDADKIHADSIKATEEAKALQGDAFAQAGVIIREHNYSPIAAQGVISDLKQKYATQPDMLQQIQGFEQQFQANPTPDAIKAAVDPVIKASKTYSKLDTDAASAASRVQASATGAARLQAELPKIALESTRIQQENTGTVPMTPAQTASNQIAKAHLGLEQQKNKRDQAQYDATFGTATTPDGQAAADPVAQAIAEYRVPSPSPRSLQTPAGQALLKRVEAINPDFDASQFPNRQKTRQAFTTGTQGQQLNALNTSIQHLDLLKQAADAIGNGSFVPGNALYNRLRSTFGSAAPTNLATINEAIDGEVGSVIKKGAATEGEMARQAKLSNTSSSPEQIAGRVATTIGLLGGKANSLDFQYRQAMGAKDPTQLLTPEAKSVLQKYVGSSDGGKLISVTDPKGGVHQFKSQADADAFKKAAGIP